MQRFKNILVVIDSQRSNELLLARAVALAQRNQARLTVVDVVAEAVAESLRSLETPSASSSATSINIVEELPGEEIAAGIEADKSGIAEAGQAVMTPTASSIQEFIIETERQTVEQAVTMVRQAGIEVSGRILTGTPFLEIIRQVLSHGHDLVMIMAEGAGGLREILFGSTTMHLMRKSPCPVWVMKP
ncbi:MAG TPA: universal stress protein, partial [Anaerolineae bacterium]|nr:universal stress protein [Anaerolineae bacterium]